MNQHGGTNLFFQVSFPPFQQAANPLPVDYTERMQPEIHGSTGAIKNNTPATSSADEVSS